MKTLSDEQELVSLSQLKLDVNRMIVHPTIEHELLPGRVLKDEIRRPILVSPLGEGESFFRGINGGGIRNK